MEEFWKKIDKISMIEKIFIIFFLLIIINLINYYNEHRSESFENISKELVFKKNNDIYDDFYTKVFDLITYNKIITNFEIGTIINDIKPTDKSIILDVGSKTGYTINILNELTPNIIGLESSAKLIDVASERYPNIKNKFLNNDQLNNQLFINNSFTHILSLNLNIYSISNKKLFLENCFNWLMPGGYLVLHLINNNYIDPLQYIINIKLNTLPEFVDPTLLLDDSINFKDFVYKPTFSSITDKEGIINEVFKFKNGNIRRQETTYYFMSIDKIIKIAKYLGFIILKYYRLNKNSYTNNYIYILQKPL